jgi:hypothetical protein
VLLTRPAPERYDVAIRTARIKLPIDDLRELQI